MHADYQTSASDGADVLIKPMQLGKQISQCLAGLKVLYSSDIAVSMECEHVFADDI